MHIEHKHHHGHHHHLGHCHNHHHGHKTPAKRSATRNIALALALNAGFTIVEVIGGFWTGSVAILADALHDFGDTLSLMLALILERFAERGAQGRFSYGFRRLSLVAAMLTALVILGGGILILSEAIPRLWQPVQPRADGMVLLAIVGVVVNGFAALRVMKGTTLSERAISWHLVEDALGWVAVLIGSIVMLFWNVPIIDPLLSIGITLFIGYSLIRNLGETLRIFLQAAPFDFNETQFRSSVLEISAIKGVHDIHIWSLDGANHVMTMHVVVGSLLAKEELINLKQHIREKLKSFGQVHATIEIEFESERCAEMGCGK